MLLTSICFVPLLGAALMLLIPRAMEGIHRQFAFYVSLVPLLLSWSLLIYFPYGEPGYSFESVTPWIPSLGIEFRVGIDGMSLVLIILTTLLSSMAILASFDNIRRREKDFYFFMLLLECGLIGTFITLDLFMFFLFFELMLIPLYFIIGVWGGKDRIYASLKFFLYTALGSTMLLIVIFVLYFTAVDQLGHNATFYYKNFTRLTFDPWTERLLFFGFIFAFMIKMPIFPFHTWLPYAHTEAPTAGSVDLAGILLKVGVYGLLRFAIPIFPGPFAEFTPVFMILALIGVVYGAMVAMKQTDIKKMIAYLSVSHMGAIFAGILAFNIAGVKGGIIQMINHGLSTGALFLIIGMIYDRRHTRELSEFGGLAKVMPVYSVMFMIFLLSSIGLPGLNGFVGEFLILIGLAGHSIVYAAFATTGVVLGAAVMLHLYRKMMFGEITVEKNKDLKDIDNREFGLLMPLAFFCFFIGLYPYPLQMTIEPAAQQIIEYVEPHLDESWYLEYVPDDPLDIPPIE